MVDKTMKIAAIDDDPADVVILRRYLQDMPDVDVDIREYRDWISYNQDKQKHTFDLIFLDYMLPEETGLEILNKIRASGDPIPVIALTGQGDERVAAAITRAGANDYLVKYDLNPEILRRSVTSVLEQYRLTQEKELLKEQLRQSQKMETIGTLAGGIAHDFNNMLTAIMGYVDLAILKNQSGDVKPQLEKVLSTCHQMADLVQRILSFSRGEGGERSLINLDQAVNDTTAILHHTLPKNISIDLNVPDNLPPFMANLSMINQVIFNLALNAAESMPGGGTIRIRAKTTSVNADFVVANPALSVGEHLLLEIEDSGEGIAPEISERIFEPFFTTKALGTQKGTGLGLSVVWQNVRAHSGLVTFVSRPGRGATFSVYLPSTPKNGVKAEGEGLVTNIPRGTETVLIVHDEPAVMDLADSLLAYLGYRVHHASDGLMALEKYKEMEGEIDVVLLDMSMPRMGGHECLKKLQGIDPAVRVLISSGHDMKRESENLIGLGAKGVIQKPYRLADLAFRIRSVIDG